jgi:hypothetical protein
MRLPRVRFTMRTMLVAVAMSAVTLGGVIVFLRGPYPVQALLIPTGFTDKDGGPERRIGHRWSDGRLRFIEGDGRWLKGHRRYGPIVRIEWTDGSTSYRLSPR